MSVLDHPIILSVVCFATLWVSAQTGAFYRKRRSNLDETELEELGLIVGATLTLLGLVIGFTFSMAIGRYDQRKNYEEAESNAIGTEYLRTGLMPAADGAKARTLLRKYLDQRILFYSTRDPRQIDQIHALTDQLQTELWSAVQVASVAPPTVLTSLTLAGMNDVLDSQGDAQAAAWNRIPTAAWALLIAVGLFSNVLLGFRTQHPEKKTRLLFVLPLIISIAFLLIADLDSPHSGMIRIHPENLISLSDSMPAE